MTDPLLRFPDFLDEVRHRLERGRVTYDDRSFDAAPAELLAELEQEAMDLAGWGFVLWERIRRMREASEALTPALVKVVPLIWQPGGQRFQAACAILLPRVPARPGVHRAARASVRQRLLRAGHVPRDDREAHAQRAGRRCRRSVPRTRRVGPQGHGGVAGMTLPTDPKAAAKAWWR